MSVSEPGPKPPTISGYCWRSLKFLTFEPCQATHRLTSLFMLPIQPNLVGSNLTPWASNNGAVETAPRWISANTLPSFTATL